MARNFYEFHMFFLCRLIFIFVTAVVANGVHAHDVLALAGSGNVASNRCENVPPASPFGSVSKNYIRQFNTIAHRFLDQEAKVANVTPSMYAILDALINEAITTLDPYKPESLSPAERERFAATELEKIDCLLLRHAFVYPGHGLVQLLSDGLGPTVYVDQNSRTELRNQLHNVRRQRFIDADDTGYFYVVDCDIASYLYLAIAEVMNYPIFLVEIPRHNFVRWVFEDKSFLDFETMDGAVTDDAYYINNWSIPAFFVGKGGVLQSMNNAQTSAYHLATVAVAFAWASQISDMVNTYKLSISTDSTHAFALNNLAWFYAAAPRQEWRNGTKAVEYGKRATALISDGDGLDTLACAYAQNGDFATAVEKEMDALNSAYTPFGSDLRTDLALFQGKPPRPCTDDGFGHDPAPFRPGTGIAKAASYRDLQRLH